MLLPLPRKIFAAVEAVLYIAYNATSTPINAKEIAARQGLPPRYLEQIMQKLVHTGILRGVRGPRGGYVLARERRRISIGDICEVLQGDEEEPPLPGTMLGRNVVLPVWQSVGEEMLERLREITIATLCEQAADRGVAKGGDAKLDFTI